MTDLAAMAPDRGGAESMPAPTYRFTFHGRGGEYFGIWIVNLLLSIVTLGIYSAWAKVRTERYFHGATELDGARFGYHGTPKAILIGRIIAIALFVPYMLIQQSSVLGGFAVGLIFLLVMPWLVTRATRFRLRVTSYRNLRFSLDPAPWVLKSAYYRFLALPLLTVPSIGLLLPYTQHQQLAWLVENSRYGTTPLRLDRAVKQFYLAYFKLIATGIFLTVIFFATIFAFIKMSGLSLRMLKSLGDDVPVSAIAFTIFAGLAFEVAVITLVQIYRIWFHKLIYDRISLGDIRVNARYTRWGLARLFVINLLMLLFTLGFAYPWIRCRTARYMLDHLELTAPVGLDHFVAANAEDVSAIGDQIASVFDIDIGIGF